MTLQLYVTNDLQDDLAKFIETKSLDIRLTDKPDDCLSIEKKDRELCTQTTLYAGGRMGCQMAWMVAEKHDVTVKQFGELLNHLNIKICKCTLGCF